MRHFATCNRLCQLPGPRGPGERSGFHVHCQHNCVPWQHLRFAGMHFKSGRGYGGRVPWSKKCLIEWCLYIYMYIYMYTYKCTHVISINTYIYIYMILHTWYYIYIYMCVCVSISGNRQTRCGALIIKAGWKSAWRFARATPSCACLHQEIRVRCCWWPFWSWGSKKGNTFASVLTYLAKMFNQGTADTS